MKPNFKTLGPRFGKKVKAIAKALGQGDSAAHYAAIQQGAIRIDVEGETVELAEEDLDVRLSPKEGFAAAQGRDMVVVVTTEITPELRREGWVRDFIRIVQDIRKELGLAYDARIAVWVKTDAESLRDALTGFQQVICDEVLANTLDFVSEPPEAGRQTAIEDMELIVGVQTVDVAQPA